MILAYALLAALSPYVDLHARLDLPIQEWSGPTP